MEATVTPPITAPQPIHTCPECSHWLPEGTLACPDCHTLTYGRHLSELAAAAQVLEQEQKWTEARDRWQAALSWLPEDTRQSIGIQQHIAALDQRLQNEADRKARWTKRLGPLAPIALFLLKAKSFLFFALKAKFLLSFLGFFALYWFAFGWPFAAGFTIGILVHEMGHFITARRRGLKANLPIFIPGFGAYVRWFGSGVSLETLAAISLAGPLYGLGYTVVCWLLAWQLHSPLFLVLANTAAWYNIANLGAVFGLDGSMSAYAMTRLQRLLAVGLCIILFALTCSPDWTSYNNPSNHYVFLFVAITMLWRCFTNDAPDEPHTATLTVYMATIIVLGFILHLTTFQILHTPTLAEKYFGIMP